MEIDLRNREGLVLLCDEGHILEQTKKEPAEFYCQTCDKTYFIKSDSCD